MIGWLKGGGISGFLTSMAITLVLGASLPQSPSRGQNEGSRPERARVALTHALPPLDGSRLRVTVVEVNYGPGEESLPHTHPCPVVGYVLEGDLRTQVAGEAAAVYGPGESFYEAPNGVHQVSANASKSTSTRFLAFFVCDTDAPLSAPAHEPKGASKP